MGGNGYLCMRRSRSPDHSARHAFFAQFAKARRLVGGTPNHRHRISARVLSEVRHVSAKFSAASARDIRELSQRPWSSAELLPLRSVGRVRRSRAFGILTARLTCIVRGLT